MKTSENREINPSRITAPIVQNRENNCTRNYGIYSIMLLLLRFCRGKGEDVKAHSKTTGVKSDPERVHWGQTQFRVNDDPLIDQLTAEYDPELGQSDHIICQVCRKLTKFWVTFDPELGPTPMDPFPGHIDPGVFGV